MATAKTDEFIYQQLRKDGNTIISVKEQSILNKEISFGLKNKVKSRDLAIFCRQFRSILVSGITIIEALGMLVHETEKKTMKNAIIEIQTQVKKGETLANAMVYPIVILVVTIGVIVILMTTVIPNFKDMFSDMGAELPRTTKTVMAMNNFILQKWYLILIIIAAIAVVIIAFKNSDVGSQFFGKMAIKFLIFGKMNIKSCCARFARTMSTLMSAGISMLDAITITANIINNKIIKGVLEGAKADVERGVPLSEPMERSGMIPPHVYHMLKIGEETGSIEKMMDSLQSIMKKKWKQQLNY